ncbi:NADPH oxidase isoform 1 [Mycena galericulata]|nr:NADPH oxidase isoform 1 [Mycena galericulata]
MGETWVQRELLTPRRLLFNAIFYGLHLFLFAYGWFSQETNSRLSGLNSLKYSVWISRGAGLDLAFDGGLILVPMLRNAIRVVRPKLTWLFPADENIWFHRQVAYSMAFWAMVHTTAHYVNFINVERTQIRPEYALQIHYTQPGGITGHFMLLIMLLIYTTASRRVRTQCFEAFWYTHHLAFFFMIGLYTHATGCFVRDYRRPLIHEGLPVLQPGPLPRLHELAVHYLAGDLILRGARVARGAGAPFDAAVACASAMELRILKPSFKHTPGQWLFIQVPEISHFQWHPFTITSAPKDPYVSLHIRQVGDFTHALGERLGAGPAVVARMTASAMNGTATATDSEKRADGSRGDFFELDLADASLPAVRIDGPYGAPAEDVFNFQVAVLVGAGIGITPFASILKDIWYRQRENRLGSLRRVEFFWICRDAPSFGWFQSILAEVEAAQADPNFLRINIYLTQKINEDMLWNIAVNSADTEYDPLTLLRSRTMFGRPDWMAIYGQLRQAIEAGDYLPGSTSQLQTKVGTYFCGPGPIGKAVKAATIHHSGPAVTFSFAKEHF